MSKRKLKLHELRSILRRFGVSEVSGKGSHIKFIKQFEDGRYSYPVPANKDVLECYVTGCRKKFRLTEADGVSDEEFYGD